MSQDAYNPFIYVVFADGKIDFVNENCHYRFYDKKWSPLMPFIQSHFVLRPLYNYDHVISDTSTIEMGVYNIEENKKYKAPFVWNHIKIKSLEVIKGEENKDRGSFKAVVVIYPQKYSIRDNYEHTFVVKNGVYFFMDSILSTINHLLDKGYSIKDINFGFLEEQCLKFNFLAANGQSRPTFEFSHEFYKHGFYELITKMKIEVYNNGCGSRNGDYHWLDVKIHFNTTDIYIVHVIKSVLKGDAKNINVLSDNNVTTFTFETEHWSSESTCCGIYSASLANDEVHKKIREKYTMELLIEGAKMLNKAAAVEYLATNHNNE